MNPNSEQDGENQLGRCLECGSAGKLNEIDTSNIEPITQERRGSFATTPRLPRNEI